MTALEWLAEIEARAEAATKGPWEAGQGTHGDPSNGPEFVEVRSHTEGAGWLQIAEFELCAGGGADAEFIAHARTDVPLMAAALRAVLELHGTRNPPVTDIAGDWCAGCSMDWPCTTRQAACDALGVTP